MMDLFLQNIQSWPLWVLCIFFLAENAAIMLGVLVLGNRLQRKPAAVMFAYSPHQWRIAWITTLLNTLVTYMGYWLWTKRYISLSTDLSVQVLVDALFFFLAMDFLMYVFHYGIHKTWLYKVLHRLHHEAADPEPIDLFVLHPLETLSFGALWLFLLLLFDVNIYGVIIYLVINVLFGMAGHLGMEPVPENIRRWRVLKYLGTSTFHHTHHRDEQCNFGFYTSIWDRLFHTFRENR